MLQKMRQGAQSFGAKVLVVVIIVVLALFGFGAFNIFVSPDPAVATVNGEDIPRSVVEMEVERQRQDLVNRLGPDFDPDLIDGAMIRRQVVENLINRALLTQAAARMNMAISEEQVDRLIVQNPQFQLDGRFDPDLFRMLVASIGHSPASFRREYTNDLLLSQLTRALTETPFVTDGEVRQVASLVNQRRDLAYMRIRADDFVERASEQVTDQDVEAYYDVYRADFVTEDRVDLAYVALSVDQVAEQVDLDIPEQEVRELYAEERERGVIRQERHVAHILVDTDDRTEEEARALIDEVQARLLAGEAFEDLAREYSDDAGSAGAGGDLGYVGEGMLEPELEAVLWGMDVGDVSGPVETQLGVHLVRLLDIEGDAFPSFEEMEAELRQQLRMVHAREAYADRVRELDRRAFDLDATLELLAEEFGLEVRQVEGIGRDRGPAPFNANEMRREAFSQDVLDGLNSRVVQVGDSAYVMRLVELHQARQLTLEEVADDIRETLVRDEAQALARQTAEEAEDRLLAGDGAGVVARAFDSSWQVVESARRDAADVPRAVTERAFDLPRPGRVGRSVGIATIGVGDFAVITVTRVIEGDYEAIGVNERELLRQQLEQSHGNEALEALFQTIRDEARIRRRI
jgi:peptidyl-prolyl cis-trans isomerase D